MFYVLVVILVIVCGYLFIRRLWRQESYPIGPNSLPLVGDVFLLKKLNRRYPYKALEILKQKYGPIFTLNIFGKRMVVLCDYKSIKEFNNIEENLDASDAMPFIRLMKELWFGDKAGEGILFATGERWQEQRRFTAKTLKEFGFGKSNLNSVILHEVEELTTVLKRRSGTESSSNLERFFNFATLNMSWQVIAGIRYSQEDENINCLIKNLDTFFSFMAMAKGPLGFLPLFKYIPKYRKIYLKAKDATNEVRKTIEKNIEKHMKAYEESNECRDYIDAYIKEINKNRDDYFTVDQLVINCLDLFVASITTTPTTLLWSILWMSMYPTVQEKVFREIKRKIGRERQITIEDRIHLPYTHATVNEIQRFTEVIPETMSRFTTKRCRIGSIDIPKHTHVLINLYSVMNDLDHWIDPCIFKPERFINPRSGGVVNNEYFIPFGIGKRSCLGEQIARQVLFTFYANIMQNFRFIWNSSDKPNPNPALGITQKPKKFNVKVEYRE